MVAAVDVDIGETAEVDPRLGCKAYVHMFPKHAQLSFSFIFAPTLLVRSLPKPCWVTPLDSPRQVNVSANPLIQQHEVELK